MQNGTSDLFIRVIQCIFLLRSKMGCAKSSPQEPQHKNIENHPIAKAITAPKVNQQHKLAEVSIGNNHAAKQQQSALHESSKPTWNQPNEGGTNLACPTDAKNVNDSPVNIIYSSDSLTDLHNIGILESKHYILPSHSKASAGEQNPQENAPPNEIRKLATVVEETRDELKTINHNIKHNSEHLDVRIREQDIAIAQVEQSQSQNHSFGQEQHLFLFRLPLPSRISIHPMVA